jgi:hypothetical protein
VLDKLAFLVSALSSPFLVICGFALWVISQYAGSRTEFFYFSALFVISIIVVPLVWIQVGIRTGKFSDYHVMFKEQRFEPFVVATISAAIFTLAYIALGTPRELIALGVSLIANGTVFAILSKKWKVSIHAASYAAAVLIVAMLIDRQLYWLILLLPLIVWARIRRRRHNVGQALAAAVIVSAVTLVVYFVMRVGPFLNA